MRISFFFSHLKGSGGHRFSLSLAIAVLSLCSPAPSNAAIDPARAAAIDVASALEEKGLKAQNEVQLLQSTGHLWTTEQVSAVSSFQQEFCSYISTFNSLLAIAAEIYGVCYEATELVSAAKALNNEISNHPENAFAVALSTRKNNIYSRIITTGTQVASDIRTVVITTSTKATEAQRIKALCAIRPKLRSLCRELRILARYIRYTTVSDVWREISGRHYSPATKKEIVSSCHRKWKAAANTAAQTKGR